MSLVLDRVRRLDAYLDRLPPLNEIEPSVDESVVSFGHAPPNPRLDDLSSIIQALGTSSSRPLLSAQRIKRLLASSGLLEERPPLGEDGLRQLASAEPEIEWLLVCKATIQLYGIVLDTLLGQIIPLSDDIWYWDDVLGSHSYTSLYAIQTSPWRLWAYSQEIYAATSPRLAHQWKNFFSIVQATIQDRSLSNIRRRVLSPLTLYRAEARQNRRNLQRLRELTATGLGVLMNSGFQFGHDDGKTEIQVDHVTQVVGQSVALMEMVLLEAGSLRLDVMGFEKEVFGGVRNHHVLSAAIMKESSTDRPGVVARHLVHLIDKVLPEYVGATRAITKDNGRPNRLVRYWLPASIGLVSSTTVLRILVNRKADILEWFLDFGATVRDFWFNWVVEPVEKIVSTIRHDKTSEIAIMSRDSLKADRESLERMVVDFALDKPHFVTESGAPLTDQQVADIRSKVAEGDVTPVLRAFEKDLQSPFMGTLRGDLVRSLLIQVQKTKVDLEVAMTGIDSLLKSQELVFGFVGLTPGVLVSYSIFQYFRGVFGGRSGLRQSRKTGKAIRILRNIDRILSQAHPSGNSLQHKDHGLLLCEVHVLRNLVDKLMPREVGKEFLEDLDYLSNEKDIRVQEKALERIRWAYARWLK
ncbi:hypothetical protein LCI18_007613 [Fusarium solani-melongenae]|uniref:Uncharacterized protein n=1 Tax=Fusarium solani subsp. cucurbitae TaxID=2747967 RepID=A0ACD3Z9B8_FUSSC|nr:hypothetical protein LCI18_007613 [Fusarium solani-melongenae]